MDGRRKRNQWEWLRLDETALKEEQRLQETRTTMTPSTVLVGFLPRIVRIPLEHCARIEQNVPFCCERLVALGCPYSPTYWDHG